MRRAGLGRSRLGLQHRLQLALVDPHQHAFWLPWHGATGEAEPLPQLAHLPVRPPPGWFIGAGVDEPVTMPAPEPAVDEIQLDDPAPTIITRSIRIAVLASIRIALLASISIGIGSSLGVGLHATGPGIANT